MAPSCWAHVQSFLQFELTIWFLEGEARTRSRKLVPRESSQLNHMPELHCSRVTTFISFYCEIVDVKEEIDQSTRMRPLAARAFLVVLLIRPKTSCACFISSTLSFNTIERMIVQSSCRRLLCGSISARSRNRATNSLSGTLHCYYRRFTLLPANQFRWPRLKKIRSGINHCCFSGRTR